MSLAGLRSSAAPGWTLGNCTSCPGTTLLEGHGDTGRGAKPEPRGYRWSLSEGSETPSALAAGHGALPLSSRPGRG